ncbi:MAG: hypothetical protein Q7R47_03865 [Candidatus Diapherotrites archaeon]|nr:hypothetical protein [Candidatus Diapherotrites archaeon]
MVKFRFCPACGAIDVHPQPDGTDKCNTCKYVGVAMEGAMDKLNDYRKKLKSGYSPATNAVVSTAPSGSASTNPLIGYTESDPNKKTELKPKKIERRSTDDFEIY